MGCEQFFADISSKIFTLADPVLRQLDMKQEKVSPPAGAYIPPFTIYHVLPDLPVSWGSVPENNLLHYSYRGVVVSYDNVVIGIRGVEPRLKTSVQSHGMR
jgi:hypothetical protein